MTVVAPNAPGRLGAAVPADQLFAFLGVLRQWRDGRRAELDELDRAALAAAEPDAHTPDLTLALGLWQAISDRYEQLLVVWGSGRVGTPERERLSQLIWGRLDGNLGAGLAVSLVEALTLSDAMAAQLRGRLALDPVTAGLGDRLAGLRAAVERCRDLIGEGGGEGLTKPALDRLRERVDDLAERGGRGADVTGPLGQLEREVALAERDLIVAAARRRDLHRDRERAEALVAALEGREAALRKLADRCRAAIADPPHLAVPDVSNLGPVPATRAALDAFIVRLTRVQAAFGYAEEAYRRPLDERDELAGRLHGYRAMAQHRGHAEDAGILEAWTRARARLAADPCDVAAARDAVADYQDAVRSATGRALAAVRPPGEIVPGLTGGGVPGPPGWPLAGGEGRPAPAEPPPAPAPSPDRPPAPAPATPPDAGAPPGAAEGTVPEPVATPLAPPDPASA